MDFTLLKSKSARFACSSLQQELLIRKSDENRTEKCLPPIEIAMLQSLMHPGIKWAHDKRPKFSITGSSHGEC